MLIEFNSIKKPNTFCVRFFYCLTWVAHFSSIPHEVLSDEKQKVVITNKMVQAS